MTYKPLESQTDDCCFWHFSVGCFHYYNERRYWLWFTRREGTAHPSEHRSSSPVCSGVRVTRSWVLCVCLVDRFLSFCPFSFGHCAVCPSIYGFWLPLWYLKTLIDIDDVLFLGKNPQKYTTKKQINSG